MFYSIYVRSSDPQGWRNLSIGEMRCDKFITVKISAKRKIFSKLARLLEERKEGRLVKPKGFGK